MRAPWQSRPGALPWRDIGPSQHTSPRPAALPVLFPPTAMLRATLLLLVTALLTVSSPTLARPFEAVTLEQLRERATTDFAAPSGWKVSWNIAGKRASIGASTNSLSYVTLARSGAITQALVNTCVSRCASTASCGFVQVVQLAGSSEGTVLCTLHSAYVASTKATFTAPPNSAGSVVTTYGIRNLNTPVTGGTGGTNTTVVNNTAFPASPSGATLVQLKPCARVAATVPMFVNNQYARSSASAAYIVQHGSARNFNDYFAAVQSIVGSSAVVVAPNFYVTSDGAAPATWYQPGVNLAWGPEAGTWTVGADAIAPTAGTNTLGGGQCSSYDTYDSLLAYLANRSLFPNLRRVYFVAHSGGANMVSRYSQIYNGNFPFSFRYILANAANQAYFTSQRPVPNACSAAFQYPFQLVATNMPRYVAARFTSASALFSRWRARDVVSLVGNMDTADRFPGGVEDCASQAEGGQNRRERNYAWWAYQNILAGTNANVSAYTGYQQLLDNGARTLSSGAFNHQNCVVDGVGHDQNAMFSSACGRAAMTQSRIPAGVGATYP